MSERASFTVLVLHVDVTRNVLPWSAVGVYSAIPLELQSHAGSNEEFLWARRVKTSIE